MVKRIKKGVSPVIATVIIITVTLVVGFAVFSFVNSEAAAASGAMGQSTSNYVNYLRERFVITNVVFNYPMSGNVTVWFYNNGATNTKIVEIRMDEITTPRYTVSFTELTLVKGQSASVTFSPPAEISPITSGTTYYIKAVGEFGNVVVYYQGA